MVGSKHTREAEEQVKAQRGVKGCQGRKGEIVQASGLLTQLLFCKLKST